MLMELKQKPGSTEQTPNGNMDSFRWLGRYNLLALQKLNSSYIAYMACVVYFREVNRMFEKNITQGQFKKR